ncbi:hypothetical protein BkAM31D_15675 [Halalkalibacter krulwichiae]|uniref:Uncharacterized protein n=1 Tax=Halalkalibacter krulwichiae TaxID=199441 RepID=A0A1X9MCP4_9BACI|nr:hypothetical protein BkAM31D_15675 [Halalkalibacter krulwichiae]
MPIFQDSFLFIFWTGSYSQEGIHIIATEWSKKMLLFYSYWISVYV